MPNCCGHDQNLQVERHQMRRAAVDRRQLIARVAADAVTKLPAHCGDLSLRPVVDMLMSSSAVIITETALPFSIVKRLPIAEFQASLFDSSWALRRWLLRPPQQQMSVSLPTQNGRF